MTKSEFVNQLGIAMNNFSDSEKTKLLSLSERKIAVTILASIAELAKTLDEKESEK